MKLGLFGGTFDPVHYGHLLLAEQCREQCALDAVWFIPTGNPPHKRNHAISPANARAEMLDFAVAGHSGFAVNRMELERKGTTFTVDTLEQLHAEDPSRELFFLVGADSLADMATWREPKRIAELATIVALNRGDAPQPDVAPLRSQLGDAFLDRIRYVRMPGIDLSATDIRRRVSEGKSIRYMTPCAVEEYIRQHELYRA